MQASGLMLQLKNVPSSETLEESKTYQEEAQLSYCSYLVWPTVARVCNISLRQCTVQSMLLSHYPPLLHLLLTPIGTNQLYYW